MALNPPSPTPSVFSGKKKSTVNLRSAASYLSALSQMDAMSRSRSSTPSSTPALSFSSSLTASSASTEVGDDDYYKDGLSLPSTPPTSETVYTSVHAEFGHCSNPDYRYESHARPGDCYDAIEIDPPYYVLFTTYISYMILICIGHLRDFVGKRLAASRYGHLKVQKVCRLYGVRKAF